MSSTSLANTVIQQDAEKTAQDSDGGLLRDATDLQVKENEQSGTDTNSGDVENNNDDNDNGNGNGHPQERKIRGFRWFLVCVAIFSANLLYGLDTTISADIQASVSSTYDNVTQLGWIGFGFGLGSTVAILPLGQSYGIFNVKWLYISCLVMFAAGSALCGGAPSMSALIVGRVWAGTGGAGMYLGTLNIVSYLTTPKEQSFYISFEGFMYGAGAILGPIVGGLFADSNATWRWAFYLNLVIFGITAPMYIFALPSLPRQEGTPFRTKIAELDWLGIVLNTGIYVSFTLAFGFGGAIWDWSDGRFIACIVVFGVITIVFCITQKWAFFTTKDRRLFPCEFLGDFQLVLLYVTMACGGAALFVVTYYVPLYFLFVHGESGTNAAVRLLPFVAFYIAAILSCGYALPRVGYHWLWFLGSGILLTAGGGAMYSIGANTPTNYTYGFSTLLGFGLTSSQASYYVATTRVKETEAPRAIQFINMAQGSSQLLGLLIASAIFQNQAYYGMKRVLRGLGYSRTEIQAAIAGAHSQVFDEIGPELKRRCLDVIVDTIQKEYILVITAGALLTVCSLFLNKSRH